MQMGQLGKRSLWNRIGRVNSTQTVLGWLQQGKGSDPEEGVENIHSVSWTIADASLFVLAMQDEMLKGLLVDPVFLLHHAHGRVDPPRIAHIWKFLRSAIESSLVGLPLAEPFSHQFLIERIDESCYLQGSNAAEHIGAMGLRVGYSSKRSIEVPAAEDVFRGLEFINLVKGVQQIEARYSAVGKPGVDLAPFISEE